MFIGRNQELNQIKQAIDDDYNKLITIEGRRGNGKTTLGQFALDFFGIPYIKISGEKGVSSTIQCRHFAMSFSKVLNIRNDEIEEAIKDKWAGVFQLLEQKIKQKDSSKLVVFIDEFPWLHTKKSYFVQAFSTFWNNIQNGKNLYFILTGSAVAWMNKNVINTNGGLYAQIHTIINLKPFSFLETADFLYQKNNYFSFLEYLNYYLITGGVPRYLSKISISSTISDNINRLFSNEFNNEYNKLFTSSFESNLSIHKKIIDLFKYKNTYSITELIKFNLCSQSSLYNAIDDLVCSGLISETKTYGKRSIKQHNEKSYSLSDLFCYSHINQTHDKQTKSILNGYAFEILAKNNIDLIKNELGRKGVRSENFVWRNDKAQIDLIDLAHDNVCHIIECKNYNTVFNLTKDYENNLNNKLNEFSSIIPNKTELKLVLFTTYGTNKSRYFPFVNVSLFEILKKHFIQTNKMVSTL